MYDIEDCIYHIVATQVYLIHSNCASYQQIPMLAEICIQSFADTLSFAKAVTRYQNIAGLQAKVLLSTFLLLEIFKLLGSNAIFLILET